MTNESASSDIFKKILEEPLSPWMKGGAKAGEIVLSSRIRLARNLAGSPFPNRANGETLSKIVSELKPLANYLKEKGQQEYAFAELAQMTPLERNILVEKHITSPQHIAEPNHRAIIVREDAAASIMINEEDHMRLQIMKAGLDLEAAMEEGFLIDDSVEDNHKVAFTERLGFLTACPTNLGTGLRASVMLHLPVLAMTGQMCRIVTLANQTGLAVRGLYGEGSEAAGNIFQISNQVTLGQTEQQIIESLKKAVNEIVEKESSARELLASEAKDAVADRVWRSFGLLRYARKISGQEALDKLSQVRLGIDLGIINEVGPEIFNELLIKTRPNVLKEMAGNQDLNQEERSLFRADIIRKHFEFYK